MVCYHTCLWLCNPLDFHPTVMVDIELNWDELIWLGRLLVLDVAGDGALVLGVDTLSGALNEPGVDGAFTTY